MAQRAEVLLPLAVVLASVLACGGGPGPGTPLDHPSFQQNDALKDELQNQTDLALLPAQVTVLSLRIDEPPGHTSAPTRVLLRRENTIVVQRHRMLDPPDTLATPGLYLGVRDSSSSFVYITRQRIDSVVIGERPDEVTGEFEAFGRRDLDASRVIRFPYMPGGSVVLYRTSRSGSVGIRFEIPLGPAPPAPAGHLYTVSP